MAYNILIVDDSKSMRKVILKTLALSGFPVGKSLEASNGIEALEILKNEWVDLVLSDIHMPGMDGFELLRSLRQNECFDDLPIVFVTTEGNEERLQTLMELGAKAYLRKPFRPEEMRSVLCKVLGENNASSVAVDSEGFDF
jgi:two-component system, chemotaxis family, chemotaxis protein CheY